MDLWSGKNRSKKLDLEAMKEAVQEITGESSKWFNLLGVSVGRVFQEAYLLGRVVTKRPRRGLNASLSCQNTQAGKMKHEVKRFLLSFPG